MATTSGKSSSALIAALYEKGHEFDFFQAVRLCLRFCGARAMPGGFGLPRQEAIRFHQSNSFIFPAAVIDRIAEGKGSEYRCSAPVQITQTVLGMTGYSGILPWFYTKALIEENERADRHSAFAEFLDIFNHRLVSLQFSAWEKHRPHLPYERDPSVKSDWRSLAGYVFALLGMEEPSLRNRLRLPDPFLLGHAGSLSSIPRSASGLRSLLERFGVNVEILPFRGHWSRLRPSELAVLGAPGEHMRLGGGTIIGRAVWYAQASFRIRLGPLCFKEFRSFQPGGARFAELVDLVNYFTRGSYQEFEVELMLREQDLPTCRFTSDRFGIAPRLGCVGWLGTRRKDIRKRRKSGSSLACRNVILRSNDPRVLARPTQLAAHDTSVDPDTSRD